MLKRFTMLCFIVLLISISTNAQKLGEPTLIPQPATEKQDLLIKQGIQLHELKQFDEAIKKYEEVLAENPNCDIAYYEIAYAYYAKNDLKKALEYGFKAAQYKSKGLPLFYTLIGNALDDLAEPNKAIEVYQTAIKKFPNEPKLYFNLGLTYTRQKQYKEARETLKKAIVIDPGYASPHFLIAEVFYGTSYRIPALLAASRLITIEFNTARTKRALAIVQDVIKGGMKQGDKPNEFQITLNWNAPKDEGDFGGIELLMGLRGMSKVSKDKDEGKPKTEEELFVEQITSAFVWFETDDKNKSTFVAQNYYPFFAELKKRGYMKCFAYLLLQQGGNEKAAEWMQINKEQTLEFLNWAKDFRLK